MRQKRAKAYRKLMHQYHLHFGFREPYQMLIDDTFSQTLSRLKVEDPPTRFQNLLQGKVKPMITQCCMVSLYNLGKEHQSTVDMAKAWERRRCNHREAIDPQDCLKSVIGESNKHRYVLATDSQPLRSWLRSNVRALPLVHFTQAVMVLEPMTDLTRQRVEELEERKLSVPTDEASILPSSDGIKVDIVGAGGEAVSQDAPRKRKGPKGPNPLSVKKPKKEKENRNGADPKAGEQGGPKRNPRSDGKASSGDGKLSKSVGEKRKRGGEGKGEDDDDDDDDDRGQEGDGKRGSEDTGGGSKKGRRRRKRGKGHPHSSSQPSGEDGAESKHDGSKDDE
ncbi:hypothetical protein IE53DRAFT_345496 [Violaceomyces palustris]|uniref:Uncharacterized protein n=1 Tax=Violaceomyces palustris TaxID=1673888 RepID=A0ACD0NV80_9BASI|nr:hypothetical protein IE53DRAFT_345496 [Violaceomyces palustris]